MRATRTVLVPDEDDYLYTLRTLDEELLGHLANAEEDSAAGVEEAWALPADLGARRAFDAWLSIYQALPNPLRAHDRDQEGPATRTLMAVDGRTEHLPLYPVTVPEDDLEALRALHTRLQDAVHRRGDTGELGELLHQLAETAGPRTADRRPPTPAELVAGLTRVLAVLGLRNEDTELLLGEITAKGPGETVRLTSAGETAYQRVATELNTHITGGDRLSRFVY